MFTRRHFLKTWAALPVALQSQHVLARQLSDKPIRLLVATPGRLIDHLKAGRVKLNTVHTLVLDEADRMLDMGFIEDIETIIERLPKERQTLLFSATLDGSVARLAERMMREPQRIEIAGHRQKHA
ncbi:DEAD/DEAH box helicase domain protein, partial [Bordetella bronchiseptica D993]